MIARAYVQGRAGAFFGSHPSDAADRRRAVEQAFRPLAAEVADELERQNARYVPSEARRANLAKLREGAAAVVTGQQVGLFGGPLFTVYKAASAIVAARSLSRETGRPVVPIFWLQSEDHDLPEIASCSVPGECFSLSASAAQRISIAHLPLPDELGRCIESLGESLGDLPFASAHLERLQRHYRPGRGWVEAFAGLVAELFSDAGLVLVNPRTEALARAGRAIHRHALRQADAVSHSLLGRKGELEAAGFSAAVHVREGAPLSFFHPDGSQGPRRRLEPREGRLFEVGGTRSWELSELLELLESEPLRFSTSALLRPLLQDSLLPTAAYVGGPGELAYFAQLQPLYRVFDRPMPLVVPRARFVVVDGESDELLRRFGLSVEDLSADEDELLARILPPSEDREALIARLYQPFEEALSSVDLGGLDVSTPLRKTRSTVARAIGRFADRLEAARRRADASRLAALRDLRAVLQPDGAPQERVLGLPWMAARFGDEAFVARVLEQVRPFDGSLQELRP